MQFNPLLLFHYRPTPVLLLDPLDLQKVSLTGRNRIHLHPTRTHHRILMLMQVHYIVLHLLQHTAHR
jgi:hypothetical protein